MLVASHGQQYAVYADVNGIVKPLPNGKPVAITAGAGGAPGQIQWNNGGILGGFTAGKDATIDPVTGNVNITPNAVTNSKLAVMPLQTFKANNSGISASPVDISVADAKAMLAIVPSDITGLGTMATQNANTVAITGGTVSGAIFNNGIVQNSAVIDLPAPMQPSDAARKIDVDNVASGIVQRTGVQLATTVNITLSGEQIVDGVLTSLSRIMVKNQTASEQNGIYVTSAGAWARATDSDTAAELQVGFYYFVSSGSTQSATGWTIQTEPIVLNTDPVVFGQFSASTTYTAGLGLALVGNVFSNSGVRQIAGTANEISVSSPNGNVTLAFPGAITLTGKTVTGGTFNNGVISASSLSTNGIISTGQASGLITQVSDTAQLTMLAGASGAGARIQLFGGTNISLPGEAYIDSSAVTFRSASGSPVYGTIGSTGLNSMPVGQTTPAAGAFTNLAGNVTATGSTTSRSLAARFAQVVNVKDFGAVGNGVTDDTAAINLALAALTNNSCIFFPAGQYNHTGLGFPTGKTNILVKGDNAKLYLTVNANNTILTASSNSYITFEGIWFDAVGTARANGIHLRIQSDYTTVRDCIISRSSDWGIQVDGSSAVKGFVCESNFFIDTLGDGVHVMNADGWRISNNTFWQCGDDAIAALAQSTTIRPINGIISNNLIYGRTTAIAGVNTHGFRGIVVFLGKNILISGNNIYNTYASGIDVNDEYVSSLFNEQISVIGNTMVGCNVNGGPLGTVQMYWCKDSTVKDNVIISPINASAIAIAECTNLSISENDITQNLNQFFRGVVNNSDASYIGRNINASSQISITRNKFNITQASSNEAIYFVFTTGARCNNLIVGGNEAYSKAGDYILCNWIDTGKFVNNVTIGGTAAPNTGGNSTSITAANNN